MTTDEQEKQHTTRPAVTKKNARYQQKVVSLQHVLTLNPADNGDRHSFGI